MKRKRASFKARHRRNTAKGKCPAVIGRTRLNGRRVKC